MLAWCRGTSSTSRTQTTEEIISAAGTIFHSRMSTYFGGKSIRPPKKAKHLWCHPQCIWKMAPAACFSHTWRWFAICGISSKPVHHCSVSDLSCFLPLNSHDRPPVPDIRSYFYDAATGKQYVLWKVDGNAHKVPSCIKMSTLDWAGEKGTRKLMVFWPWTLDEA